RRADEDAAGGVSDGAGVLVSRRSAERVRGVEAGAVRGRILQSRDPGSIRVSRNRMTTVGRFAPSPTGPLHLGSLVAALGSWVLARRAGGRWLVRMEDLDTVRVVAGAAEGILETLRRYGLQWDGEVVYQSRRIALY